MNETPILSETLCRVFRSGAEKCEIMARALGKSSVAREMLLSASSLLSVLGEEEPGRAGILENPTVAYWAIEWVAQLFGDWPKPRSCPTRLAEEMRAVHCGLAHAVSGLALDEEWPLSAGAHERR